MSYILMVIAIVVIWLLAMMAVAIVNRRMGEEQKAIRGSGAYALIGGVLSLMTAIAVKVPGARGLEQYSLKSDLGLIDMLLLILACYQLAAGAFACLFPRPLGILLTGLGIGLSGVWNVCIGTWALAVGGHLVTTMETPMESILTAHPVLTIMYGVIGVIVAIGFVPRYLEVKQDWQFTSNVSETQESILDSIRALWQGLKADVGQNSLCRWLVLIFGPIIFVVLVLVLSAILSHR